jgi:hypothetical protein
LEVITRKFTTTFTLNFDAPKKVIVRGLGVLKPQQQLDNLIDWLGKMPAVLAD